MSYRGPICVWCGGQHLGVTCSERWHEFVNTGEYEELYEGGPVYRPCEYESETGHVCRKTQGAEIHWNQPNEE